MAPLFLNRAVTAIRTDSDWQIGWAPERRVQFPRTAAVDYLIECLHNGASMSAVEEIMSAHPELRKVLAALDEKGLLVNYAHGGEEGAWGGRYSRQLGFFALVAGPGCDPLTVQERLSNAKVVVLGVGAVGCNAALHLAAAGVGNLRLVDYDQLEWSNLNRQMLYDESQVGQEKTDAARMALRRFNSSISIDTVRMRLDSVNSVREVIAGSDFVIKAVDTPNEVLEWVNAACVSMGIGYTAGGFIEHLGVIGPTYIPGRTPCWACQGPTSLPASTKLIRHLSPTIGPLSALVAAAVSMEVIKAVTKLAPLTADGKVVLINGLNLRSGVQVIKRNPDCAICGGHWNGGMSGETEVS